MPEISRRKYASKWGLGLGILHLVSGILSMLCGLLSILNEAALNTMYFGLWGGILFVVTGICGLQMTKKSTETILLVLLVTSIVTTLGSLLMILFAGTGLYYEIPVNDPNDKNLSKKLYASRIAINTCLIVIGCVELWSGIISAIVVSQIAEVCCHPFRNYRSSEPNFQELRERSDSDISISTNIPNSYPFLHAELPPQILATQLQANRHLRPPPSYQFVEAQLSLERLNSLQVTSNSTNEINNVIDISPNSESII